MDFQALSILTEAASAGSIAEAARRLRVPPMTASRSLARLESELGVRLFHRTTRSLALTNEGQTFLAHAKVLLEERDAALISVRPAGSGATGLLRLTTSSAFGRKVVAPAVAGFMKEHPAVEVDLLMSDVVVDLVAIGLDLAVRIAKPGDGSLIARRLAASPRGLFASPAYLDASGLPVTLADLRDHQCLTISGVTHWTFAAAGRTLSAKVHGRFAANSIEGIHQACLGALGIALLSRWEAAEDIASGRLREVRLANAEPEALDIWAVYPTRRMVPAKVRLFIEFLTRSFPHSLHPL